MVSDVFCDSCVMCARTYSNNVCVLCARECVCVRPCARTFIQPSRLVPFGFDQGWIPHHALTKKTTPRPIFYIYFLLLSALKYVSWR